MCRIRQPWPETITLEYHRIVLFVSPLQRRGRSVASALRRRGFAGAAGRDRGGTIMPGMEFKRKMSWYNRARGREWIKTYVNVLRMIYIYIYMSVRTVRTVAGSVAGCGVPKRCPQREIRASPGPCFSLSLFLFSSSSLSSLPAFSSSSSSSSSLQNM